MGTGNAQRRMYRNNAMKCIYLAIATLFLAAGTTLAQTSIYCEQGYDLPGDYGQISNPNLMDVEYNGHDLLTIAVARKSDPAEKRFAVASYTPGNVNLSWTAIGSNSQAATPIDDLSLENVIDANSAREEAATTAFVLSENSKKLEAVRLDSQGQLVARDTVFPPSLNPFQSLQHIRYITDSSFSGNLKAIVGFTIYQDRNVNNYVAGLVYCMNPAWRGDNLLCRNANGNTSAPGYRLWNDAVTLDHRYDGILDAYLDEQDRLGIVYVSHSGKIMVDMPLEPVNSNFARREVLAQAPYTIHSLNVSNYQESTSYRGAKVILIATNRKEISLLDNSFGEVSEIENADWLDSFAPGVIDLSSPLRHPFRHAIHDIKGTFGPELTISSFSGRFNDRAQYHSTSGLIIEDASVTYRNTQRIGVILDDESLMTYRYYPIQDAKVTTFGDHAYSFVTYIRESQGLTRLKYSFCYNSSYRR